MAKYNSTVTVTQCETDFEIGHRTMYSSGAVWKKPSGKKGTIIGDFMGNKQLSFSSSRGSSMGENYVQKSPMSKVVDTPTLKINFQAEDLRRNKKMVLRATFFTLGTFKSIWVRKTRGRISRISHLSLRGLYLDRP